MLAIAASAALGACSSEKRAIEVEQPMTDPVGPADPRFAAYIDNAFQVSQGGRDFAWYGCGGCHGAGARGPLDLGKPHLATSDRLDAAIAAHGVLGQRIPVEQRWQLTAYVRKLPSLEPEQRRRQDLDQVGEPQGSNWSGPVK
jgi:cytochrome c oxidase cbb3-type subunit 3